MDLARRVALPLSLLCAAPALAQVSGSLEGRVVDRKSGDALPGAVVVATGPFLRGPMRAVADSRGEFVLPLLPPGPVDLDVQRDGYQALSQQGVAVPLGHALRLRVELFPETGALTFATAPEPFALAQGAAALDGISREQLALVPYGRDVRTFDAALPAIPAVQRGRTIDGASYAEHVYRVDGAPVNGVAGYGLGTPLLQDFIQEIEIKRAGYRAEDGGGAGAIVQVATRTGGDALHGSVFTNLSPVEAARPAGRSYALDYGGELGGPLVRDRLSFYGGFAPVVVAPANGSADRHYQFAGKLDFAASRDQRLLVEAFGDPGPGGGGRDLLVRYEGGFVDRTFLVEALAALHHDSFDIALGPGGYAREGERLHGDLRLTSLLGPHALKAGLQASRTDQGDSGVALFAQDSVRLLPGVLLDAGLRFEREQHFAARNLLPRLGLSWDWTGRGTARAFGSWGRTTSATALQLSQPLVYPNVSAAPGVADQFAAGVESQVFRDLVAGLVYERSSLDQRNYDGVTAFARKPFADSYLLSASYTLSRLRGVNRGDNPGNAFKLDLAYLYELDARTSLSLGAAVRLLDLETAFYKEVDLRLSGTRKLGAALAASLTLDLFNLTNSTAPVPTPFPGLVQAQPPLSLRGGAALSF